MSKGEPFSVQRVRKKVQLQHKKKDHYGFKLLRRRVERRIEHTERVNTLEFEFSSWLWPASALCSVFEDFECHSTSFHPLQHSTIPILLTHFAPWLRNQFYLFPSLLPRTFRLCFPMRSCSTCNSIQENADERMPTFPGERKKNII